MRMMFAAFGSAVFFLVGPGIVAGLVPWWISGWTMQATALGWPAQAVGMLLIAAGASVLLDSFSRFALQGLGTPAPVFPTRNLVVTGLYRYVRNPMYLAVLTVILGQSLLLGNARVPAYGALVWLAFHLFVVGYEEPKLRATYGAEYERFWAAVPRWIPRLSAWHPSKPQ